MEVKRNGEWIKTDEKMWELLQDELFDTLEGLDTWELMGIIGELCEKIREK